MVTTLTDRALRTARTLTLVAGALVSVISVASAEKMHFAVVGTGGNCASCGWIEAEGEITQETPGDFDRFVQESTKKQMTLNGLLVTLNSPGGNVSAAVDLGEAFRKQGVVTAVAATVLDSDQPDPSSGDHYYTQNAGNCLSACFFAFVGGGHRAYQPQNEFHPVTGSILGIHRFGADVATQSVTSAQQLSGMLSSYLSRMGVDPAILALAASVPDNQMHTLTPAEAARFRVIDVGLPPVDWVLERTKDGRSLVASLTGTVETDESEFTQYRYRAVLACRHADAGQLTLAVQISGDVPFPEGNGYDHNIPDSFTFGLRWKTGDTTYLGSAATQTNPTSTLVAFPNGQSVYGTPQPVGAFDLSLISAGIRDNKMDLTFLLGPQSASVIDQIDNLSWVTEGKSHADEGWLPREIALPWQQRANISSLLGNNCTMDGNG